MGFWYMNGFNLTLLGKYGWKFMTNLDVMATKVFNAKYFSNDNFLGAPVRHNPI